MANKARRILCVLLAALFVSLVGLTVSAKGSTAYINTADGFCAAMSRREPLIYVDDITFEGSSSFIALTYDVKIVGKKGGSTLSNAFFEVIGTQTESDTLAVSFENVIFDGKFDSTGFPIDEEKSYSEIFGSDRKRYRAFTVDTGYFDISFSACEFTGYSAADGSVVYGGSDGRFSGADKLLRFADCKFYGNLSEYGTVVVGGERMHTSLADCEFYGNYAMSSAGCRLVNGESRMVNVSIHDNIFLPFDHKKNPDLLDAGGGLYLGGVGNYRNITVENNRSVRGGGIAVVRSGSGNGEMTFANLTVRNNTAIEEGGGLFVQSMTGQALRFFNCLFEGNTTEGLGGAMYATPIAPFSGKYAAGLIEFSLCTFRGNMASDDKAFTFYEMKHPEAQKGSIVLHGCVVADKTTLSAQNGEAPDYNFIGEGVRPENASLPRRSVGEWAKMFGELKTRAFGVGYNEGLLFKAAKGETPISPAIPVVYAICFLTSVAMLSCYLIFVRKKFVRLTLMLVCVCIVNAGHLYLSISKHLEEALLATRLTYIGSTFLPLLFFFTMAFICRHRIPRLMVAGLVGLSLLMLGATQCIGYTELFFTGASLRLEGGVVGLERGYGVLYTLYSACVVLLFAMSVAIAVYTAKKKRPVYFRCVEMVLFAGFINLTAWIIRRFVPLHFELLSVFFILTNGLLIFLYNEMSESGLWDAVTAASAVGQTGADRGLATGDAVGADGVDIGTSSKRAVKGDIGDGKPAKKPFADTLEGEPSAGEAKPAALGEAEMPRKKLIYTADELQRGCNPRLYEPLSAREAEVLALLLEGRIKSIIAEMLGISENTVKTHVKKIYLKFGVTTRIQLLYKVNLWMEQ